MKKAGFILTLFMFAVSAFGQPQNLPVLKPKIGDVPDLSVRRQKEFEQRDKAIEKVRKGRSDELTEQEKELMLRLGESEDFGIWDIEDQGCSWYCGGGPYKVAASSALKPAGNVTYNAEHAHDNSFKNAWVEGVQGYGEGQYLEYFFGNKSPRVTDILIYNGYIKSEEAWKKNSRVKRLKLWVTGRPYAILELQDTRALQTFKLAGPLGRTSDGKDLALRFEILDVYKGDVYDDTAITEIRFDGLDVHCLARGTKITMENGEKPIEAIAVGDRVRQFDVSKPALTAATVARVVKAVHSRLLTLKFDNGAELTTTEDHPFLVAGKGWCSYKPGKRQAGRARSYQPGDAFYFYNDRNGMQQTGLREIRERDATEETFTLELDAGSGFIANGIVTGLEH